MMKETLTKRDKFIYLAEKRMVKTIRNIRLIGNLSNRNNYEYSDVDIKKIVSALDREIRDLKGKFSGGSNSDNIEFKL